MVNKEQNVQVLSGLRITAYLRKKVTSITLLFNEVWMKDHHTALMVAFLKAHYESTHAVIHSTKYLACQHAQGRLYTLAQT